MSLGTLWEIFWSHFRHFLETFEDPSAKVYLELTLQSQLDIEGSGGSRNRIFSLFFEVSILDVFLLQLLSEL